MEYYLTDEEIHGKEPTPVELENERLKDKIEELENKIEELEEELWKTNKNCGKI